MRFSWTAAGYIDALAATASPARQASETRPHLTPLRAARRARAARIRIGDSPAAPLLTLIAGPSEETRRVRETKKEFGERHEIRLRWWNELLDRAKAATQLHAAISPSRYGSVGTGAGKRGLSFNYDVAQHETWVELYVDRGRGRDCENLEAFEALRAHQEEMEKAFGASLVWQALEGKRACRILAPIVKVGYLDPEISCRAVTNRPSTR